MEAAEQAEGAGNPALSRPKRSRAGCLTCRTRRRKCDEGKPKCQNCISKGFECRYAAAFQILGKNNFTPGVSTSVKYSNLRFVSAEGENSEQEAGDGATSHDMRAEEENTQNAPLRPWAQATAGEDQAGGIRIVPEATSPSVERYEFALHGLLALGNGNAGAIDTRIDYARSPRPNDTHLTPSDSDGADPLRIDPMLEDFAGGGLPQGAKSDSWPVINLPDAIGGMEPHDDRILELLKHYRYGIAPWLDICDRHQCFGQEVLQLSIESTSVRYAVLSLAEASLCARHLSQESNIAMVAHLHRQQEGNENEVHNALLNAFELTRSAVTDLSGFWMQGDGADFAQGILEVLLPEVNKKRLASCAFWLVARLQLSVALINSSQARLAPSSASTTLQAYSARGDADQVFRYAHEAVALCTDAAMFARGDEDGWQVQRYGLERVELWNTLVASFENWYKNRPQDFHAIVELYPSDGMRTEDEFPTIIFTGGAAVLANQLYHTGMLIMLQNKPRFLERAGPNTPFMSLLWHSHRICGTAISNDRWDCWDPTLLASLVVAARTATHQSQHTVILNTLEHAQQLTGFNISHHLDGLRDEWRLAEGW